jgi:uncharacterized surface protein with fasciclin (FAS1) repeats
VRHTERKNVKANPLYLALLCLTMCLVLFACSAETGDTSGSASQKTEFADNHGQAGVKDDESAPNAELENVLVNPGPLTVFAPNDAAFAKLPEGTVETLLKPENKGKLATIVTSHASPGTFTGELLKDGSQIYLATGQYVDVEVKDGVTYVNGAKILGTVDASNGVVHVVDTVFLFD